MPLLYFLNTILRSVPVIHSNAFFAVYDQLMVMNFALVLVNLRHVFCMIKAVLLRT